MSFKTKIKEFKLGLYYHFADLINFIVAALVIAAVMGMSRLVIFLIHKIMLVL